MRKREQQQQRPKWPMKVESEANSMATPSEKSLVPIPDEKLSLSKTLAIPEKEVLILQDSVEEKDDEILRLKQELQQRSIVEEEKTEVASDKKDGDIDGGMLCPEDLKMMDVFELFIVFVFENKENENTAKQASFDDNTQFMIAMLRGKWIAELLSGKRTLPSRDVMMHSIMEFYHQRNVDGIPKYRTHDIGNFEYSDEYADHTGFPHLEEWRKELSLSAIINSYVNLETYRDSYEHDLHLLQLTLQDPYFTQLRPQDAKLSIN
ncbi:unnamed protein product [Camellia sinensis]